MSELNHFFCCHVFDLIFTLEAVQQQFRCVSWDEFIQVCLRVSEQCI